MQKYRCCVTMLDAKSGRLYQHGLDSSSHHSGLTAGVPEGLFGAWQSVTSPSDWRAEVPHARESWQPNLRFAIDVVFWVATASDYPHNHRRPPTVPCSCSLVRRMTYSMHQEICVGCRVSFEDIGTSNAMPFIARFRSLAYLRFPRLDKILGPGLVTGRVG